MELNGKAVYFVALKLFLRDGDALLVTHDVFGAWDLPGGRIKKDEFAKPMEDIIERKVTEELGADVTYQLGQPKVFFRVERLEQGLDQKVRIFAVGYEAQYTGGNIALGKHHDSYEWVNVKTFKPETLFEGGWLVGIREYLNKVS
jgi:8-oxo-dGTP pyrophosphatase MutT (NUDIX family)